MDTAGVFLKEIICQLGVGIFIKTKQKIDLKKYYAGYLKILGINEIITEEAHGFVIPVSPRSDTFVKNNVFLMGDSAGFGDPILAEGISNAILSGVLAAQSIAEANLDSVRASELYQKKLENSILPEIETGVILSKFFYEKKILSNIFVKKYGQLLVNATVHVFVADRTYPKDYKAAIRRKIKEAIF